MVEKELMKLKYFFYDQESNKKYKRRSRKYLDDDTSVLKHLKPSVSSISVLKAYESKDKTSLNRSLTDTKDKSTSKHKGKNIDLQKSISNIRSGTKLPLDSRGKTRSDLKLSSSQINKYQFLGVTDAQVVPSPLPSTAFFHIKYSGTHILDQLTHYLYKYEDIISIIPPKLNSQLSENWESLVKDAVITERDWQTRSMKLLYKRVKLFERISTVENLFKASSRQSLASQVTSTKSSQNRKRSSGSRTMNSRSNLPEVTPDQKLPGLTSRSTMQNINARPGSSISHTKYSDINRHLAKDSLNPIIESCNSLTKNSISNDHNAKPFSSVIQFLYSSKQAHEQGWIVQNKSETDLQLNQVLEWILNLLKNTMNKIREERQDNRIKNRLANAIILYYPNPKEIAKVIRPIQTSYSERPTTKPFYPKIPDVSLLHPKDRSIFAVTNVDGTVTVRYPSGRLALVKSVAGSLKKAYTILAFDDDDESTLLAVFTTDGCGSCYYPNGNICFQTLSKSAHISEFGGTIAKKWSWPRVPTKIASPVVVELNDRLAFRCFSSDHKSIIYKYNKNSIRVSISPIINTEIPESSSMVNMLMTDISFSSNAAKDIPRKGYITKLPSSKNKRKKLIVSAGPSISKITDEAAVSKTSVTKSHVREVQQIFLPDQSMQDIAIERDILRLKQKIRCVVDAWMEHYRENIGLIIDPLGGVPGKVKIQPVRAARSAVDIYHYTVLALDKEKDMSLIKAKKYSRPRSNSVPGAFYKTGQLKTPLTQSSRFQKFLRDGKMKTASSDKFVCVASLRSWMLGLGRPPCKCTHHYITFITDVEYSKFLKYEAPSSQIIIIYVVSSLFPESDLEKDNLLSRIHRSQCQRRSNACEMAAEGSFRILKYDVVTAAGGSSHTQPLLLTKHNVVPGMLLMYMGGRLLFCDNVLNGQGYTRTDFQKQITKCRYDARRDNFLPPDFKFSPIKCRQGKRSGYGGEIGGAGVDFHGGVGTTKDDLALRTVSSIECDVGIPQSSRSSKKNVQYTDIKQTMEEKYETVMPRKLSQPKTVPHLPILVK